MNRTRPYLLHRLGLVVILAAGLIGSPARAGDDTVELPAGGLLIVPDDRIVVEALEVVLGRGSVKVTYAMRNTASEPVAQLVAWPFPEIDAGALGGEVVVLSDGDPQNFATATATADGAAVKLALEQRASAFARDCTDLLQAAGLPLNPLASGVDGQLASLPQATLALLLERGIVRRDDARIVANWSVRTTGHWRQTIAPGASITVGLSYAPVTASGRWGAESLAELKEAYCIDETMAAAIAARADKAGRALITHRLTYVEGNGPGWSRPIPDFRLAFEKSGFETLIASCRGPMRVVGPTLSEWVAHAYQPGEEIRVLFIN